MLTEPNTAIDRGTIRRRLQNMSTHWQERVEGWKQSGAKHIEKSYAQQLWSDLLKCFGVIPERIDLFEQDAVRASSGRTGYIDLFWSGLLLGEAKSPGEDLAAAYDQALDYLRGGSIGQHEFPRYVLVTDFDSFDLRKLGDEGWKVHFDLAELADHVDQLIFLGGQEAVSKAEEEEASIHASKLMATLYTAMLGDEDADEAVGEDAPTDPDEEDWQVQKTSVFLTRVLFLLYGDDAGLWEEDLFYRFVLYDTTADNLGAQLAQLFQVLNTPENRRRHLPDSMAKFPYVNGGLFADSWPSEFFTAHMYEALLAACRFRWTRISPAVFGSMFQLVKSKEARRADGEHYTTETNILKVIKPLFLDGLRDKARRLISNKSTTAKALRKFRDSLAEMVFLDPACGCGNFLVVAYRELRAIETDIIVALRAKEGQSTASMDVSLDQRLSIGQFHGFELNWWPAKIAETAMFLVDHQANRALAAAVGDTPERLPITITAHIHHVNALRLGWEAEIPRTSGATYVFGNPPFLGHKERSEAQGKELRDAWGRKNVGHLDYVTAWFAKALSLLKERPGEFAYVATNSVTQGESVAGLFDVIYKQRWRIKFAHRSFVWDSDAPGKAAVHCVVIGFTRDKETSPLLYGMDDRGAYRERVREVSPYLIPGPPVTVVHPTRKVQSPALSPLRAGSTPLDWDNFVVTQEQYDMVSADPVASKYLRPYIGGDELINNLPRWCLWLAGEDFDPADIKRSEVLKKRINTVHIHRLSRKRVATVKAAATPHLFGEIRQPETDYLAVPQSFAEKRRYATVKRLTADNIASVKLFTAEDPDGFLFAIISSSMFILWQKTVG